MADEGGAAAMAAGWPAEPAKRAAEAVRRSGDAAPTAPVATPAVVGAA